MTEYEYKDDSSQGRWGVTAADPQFPGPSEARSHANTVRRFLPDEATKAHAALDAMEDTIAELRKQRDHARNALRTIANAGAHFSEFARAALGEDSPA